MKQKIKVIINFAIFLLILSVLIILFWNPLTNLSSNPEKVRNYINSFGILAPVIFISFTILQVLFAPIPGQVSGIAGGYIFGAWWGIVYSMIGLVIGSFIVFFLARKFGRTFVEKIIDKKILKKFDSLIKRRGIPFLFLIYLLPLFPDDAISYLAGLTKIKMRNLIIISAAGRLPGYIVLSLIGAGFGTGDITFSIWLFAIIAVFSILIFLNRKRLENQMEKIAKKWTKK